MLVANDILLRFGKFKIKMVAKIKHKCKPIFEIG